MTNKREQINFKKGDKLFSPKYGYVTIINVRGSGREKEFMIDIGDGEKRWYLASQIKGTL
jgi:hypothetical protein